MCNVLIRDVKNAVYLLAVQDDGIPYLVQIPDVTYKGALIPILRSSSKNWIVSAELDESIKATQTSTPGIEYIPLVSPLGFTFKFFALDDGGFDTVSTGTMLPDSIPRPVDVSMSVWPVSTGIICVSCGNASVTVSADFSCWCCACNAFVPEDDTNMLVMLEE